MLLRRITEHVKTQNWFAVSIDFLIVIVGVFIGIQVANWNDERVESANDAALLARLQTDFARIVEWGERVTPRVSAQSVDTQNLISVIRRNSEPVLDDNLARMLVSTVHVWAPYEDSGAYQEIVEAGTLSRIANPGLRSALSLYTRAIKSGSDIGIRQLEIRDRGIMEQAVQFTRQPRSEKVVVNSYDWNALKKTEPHLQVVLQSQILRARWGERSLASAREILELVKQELATK